MTFEWLLDYGVDDREIVSTAMLRVGRLSAPTLLVGLHRESGGLSPAVAALVGDAWSGADLPEQCLDHDDWRELFQTAGYIVDGQPALRPNRPLTLWRGASHARRLGWAWTADRAQAEWFANRSGLIGEDAMVWQADVEPWRLFAYDNGRKESEYVIDTDGLVVVDVGRVQTTARATGDQGASLCAPPRSGAPPQSSS
jgi:hypothetical protein